MSFGTKCHEYIVIEVTGHDAKMFQFHSDERSRQRIMSKHNVTWDKRRFHRHCNNLINFLLSDWTHVWVGEEWFLGKPTIIHAETKSSQRFILTCLWIRLRSETSADTVAKTFAVNFRRSSDSGSNRMPLHHSRCAHKPNVKRRQKKRSKKIMLDVCLYVRVLWAVKFSIFAHLSFEWYWWDSINFTSPWWDEPI